MKTFYPNIEYNKKQRVKCLVLAAIALFFLLGTIATFSIVDPKNKSVFLIAFGLIIVVGLTIMVLKAYPTKNIPIIQIDEKYVYYGKNTKVELSDIVKVKVNVMVPTNSRLKPEIEAELKAVANNLEMDEFFGDVDLVVNGKKGEETLYASVLDCVGALQALVDFGVKNYEINVFSGKVVVKSDYKIYKNYNNQENGIGISRKERFRQLL